MKPATTRTTGEREATDDSPYRRRWVIAALLAGPLLAVSIGFATAAPYTTTGPATFSGATPTPSSLITVTPTAISITASGSLDLTRTQAITLDGTPLSATADYPIGHWESDGCDTWWVPDAYNVVQLSAVASPLDGSHDLTVTVVDSAWSTSTASWSFDVAVPPGITANAPANGSILTTDKPTISARITDNDVSPAATLTVDGVPVATDYSAPTRTYSFVPTSALGEGVHSVSFVVTDAGGRTATRDWSFTVDVIADTAYSDRLPVPGSTVTTWNVAPSVTVTDLVPVYESGVSVWIDGVARTRWLDYPIGHWYDDGCDVYWVVDDYCEADIHWSSYQLADGAHTARVQVTNSHSLVTSDSWSFNVAAPPVVDQPTPPMGTRSLMPTITARVTDNGPGTCATTMTVDGAVVPATFAGGVVSWRPAVPYSDLTTHAVTVEAKDTGGRTASLSWEFRVQTVAEVTLGSHAPTQGALLDNATPTLHVRATDVLPLTGPFTMWVDGAVETASVTYPIGHWENDLETSWYVVDDPRVVDFDRQSTALVDGTHTVQVETTNDHDFVGGGSWSFRVESPPRATDLQPAPLSDIATRFPTIRATVSDNSTQTPQYAMTLNGASVPAAMDASGVVSFVPTSALSDDTTHTVTLDVQDPRGNASHYQWEFRVELLPDMPMPADCTACHVGYPDPNHPMGNCSGCHHAGNGHGVLLPETPVRGCSCHGSSGHGPLQISGTDPYYYTWSCTDCHKAQYPWIPRHDSDVERLHESTLELKCTRCHKVALTREHYRYPSDQPTKYDCFTCHSSARSEVASAIAGSNTACDACHLTIEHPHAAVDVTGTLSAGERPCSDCHSGDVITEHAKASSSSSAASCDACHAPGGAYERLGGAWDRTCETPACHDADGEQPIHTSYCTGCHDEATSGFTTAKVDFEVASVDRATACAKCHWEPAGAHPYHNSTWNCSSCHVSMGFVDPSAIPRVSTAYGWFATAGSADAGADELHAIHANPNWAGSLTKNGRQCGSCHAPAACTACHGDLSVDPGHAHHSWDESSTDYWPGTGPEDTVYGRGTTPGNEGERTVGPGLTCSNQTCHPAPTGVAAPYMVENRASQVVYSGTWGRSGTSGYTANSYSIAAAAGARATLTFTGTKVALVSDAHPYRGQARIILDGVTTATIDCYAPSTTKQIVVWESPELAAGEHTVTVEVLGTKDAASKAPYVVVDAFRVTPIAPEIRPKCSGCHSPDTYSGSSVDRTQDH